MNGNGVTAATCEQSLSDDAISAVEEQRPELLVREMGEADARPALDLARGAGRPARHLRIELQHADAELESGGDARGHREAEAELGRERADASRRETGETAALTPQSGDSLLERLGGGASFDQQCQQLEVTQRSDAMLERALAQLWSIAFAWRDEVQSASVHGLRLRAGARAMPNALTHALE